MTRAFLTQTNFTAGELDPQMFGRTDLRSFENGAATLRNVIVETTGGVRRRPGTAYVATAQGPGRLVGLETGPGLGYLLVFSDFRVDIYRDDVFRAMVTTPWSELQLAQIAWAQRDNSLIVAHPDVPLQQLSRESDTIWRLRTSPLPRRRPKSLASRSRVLPIPTSLSKRPQPQARSHLRHPRRSF